MAGIRAFALSLAVLALSLASPAWASRIVQFSPQGQVAKVESVKVQFDSAVIAFGAGHAPDPIDISCDDPDIKGQGRWVDASHWTYVFTARPGPGTHCSASVDPSFLTLAGSPLDGPVQFAFETGGPRVVWNRPYGPKIEEAQMFVVHFNAPVSTESLLADSSCLVQGLGELVPVRLIGGEQRASVLDAASVPDSGQDEATYVMQCKRLLPPDAKVRLTVQAEVDSPAGPVPGNTQVFDYEVRPPFKASFSCLRENAHAPCTPVSPIRLQFSAPILGADAQKIRLKTPAGERVPSRDDAGPYAGSITHIRFDAPFPEETSLTLALPQGLKDDAGRTLSNAGQYPLTIRTAPFPPMVKFAAAPFGVVERFASRPIGDSEADYPPTVPLTVRRVEAALKTTDLSVSPGTVRDYVVQDDAQVLRWYGRLERLQDQRYTQAQLDAVMADKVMPEASEKQSRIDTRAFSALTSLPDTTQLALPAAQADPRPFEVIGVPLPEPGFHVLEVESARLGQALLAQSVPMYVRTSALVTNLGVHFKRGRDDALVWVTTLDQGRVVADAAVVILDCSGELLASGKTDEQGLWHYRKALEAPDYCPETGLDGLYVSARIPAGHPLAYGKADFAFVFSDWNQGIEPWRFNVPTDMRTQPTTLVHTVFDRSLLRAGETVFMKHFIRTQTRDGLALPANKAQWPDRMVIQHEGSDQRYEQAINWQATQAGGLSAISHFDIPKSAKLGMYRVTLQNKDHDWFGAQEFRVEAFKLPLLTGSLKLSDTAGSSLLIAPDALDADIQISYVSGGPAGKLPVTVSGVLRDKWLEFPDYDGYSFNVAQDDADRGSSAHDAQSLFLDKKRLVLDAHGSGRLSIDTVPDIALPRELVFEASFSDPNGEIQTLSQIVSVWPAAVLAGIRTDSWVNAGQPTAISVVAVSSSGEPEAHVPVVIQAQSKTTYSSRKRLVGGFYSYDNHTEIRDLGPVCQGTTDERGLFNCSALLKTPGSIQLRAQVDDTQGRQASATAMVWVVGADELWFGGENDDRIDVIPEKKVYRPGEAARFQVRMPFREATALVAVEREGVLATQVVTLSGIDPHVQIAVSEQWGPNVYVSVLALRGRLRQVPWYSFFTWGWQRPRQWYDAYTTAGKHYVAPSAFIDLSKPAFRFGLSEIQVSDAQDRLVVQVDTDKKTYQVRGTAKVKVKVSLPNGQPAANGQVAFAAVDQALLELAPNPSWDLLGAMRQRRSYGVQTATAQMQIVGRRHYGRKALPAGGGGGKSPTRELLDTLLLWKPMVQLDRHGEAEITVPLNDAITRFKLVAIADYGASRFGTGSTDIAVTQDLQVISGLPSLVRQGDHYRAAVTVRNSTQREMHVQVQATYMATLPGTSKSSNPDVGTSTSTNADVDADAGRTDLAVRTVRLDPGQARQVVWDVEVPQIDLADDSSVLEWQLQAREAAGAGPSKRAVTPGEPAAAFDRLAVPQIVIPAVPVTTRQASLHRLTAQAPLSLTTAAPKGALSDAQGHPRGGLEIVLQSSLAGGLYGVEKWFLAYPYTCLEQLSSRAIGLRSTEQWQAIMAKLPNYLDKDGLVGYFPGANGSEVLTAYLLAASSQAQSLGLPFALPDPIRQSMTQGLLAFVQGKIVRNRLSPRKDLDVRKLLVLEALSQRGLVKPRMLDSIVIDPDGWPTSAVINWMALLHTVPSIADGSARLAQARQVLQGRLLSRGTELTFANDDPWWWLMISPEVNMAKLMLITMGQPAWADDMPRLAQGLLQLQTKGAWHTTTANLMGSLAMEKFAQHYERTSIAGKTDIRFEASGLIDTIDWDAARARQSARSMGSEDTGGGSVASAVVSERLFQPWAGTAPDTLLIDHTGPGQGWVSLRSLAAVPVTKPVMSGYQVARKITPVLQAVPGLWSRGDIYRVDLDIVAKTPSAWAVLTDPVPAGATILGSGLGRDSAIATQSELQDDWRRQPSFIERKFDVYRAYYEYLPQGATHLQYTVRLNTAGRFNLPPTRIQALYQPDVYGELPNDVLVVDPVKSE